MRLQVFPALCSRGLCRIWSCLAPRAPPGSQPCPRLAQHPNPAENHPAVPKYQALGHPSATPGEEEKGLGGFWSLIGPGCPCPSPAAPGHAKLRGCSEQPQPCVHPHWGRRGCCYCKSRGSTFPQPAKIQLFALQKEAGAGQTSSRLPCRPPTRHAAAPARPMAGYRGVPIPAGR